MKNILLLVTLVPVLFCGSAAYTQIADLIALRPTVEVIGHTVCLSTNPLAIN